MIKSLNLNREKLKARSKRVGEDLKKLRRDKKFLVDPEKATVILKSRVGESKKAP